MRAWWSRRRFRSRSRRLWRRAGRRFRRRREAFVVVAAGAFAVAVSVVRAIVFAVTGQARSAAVSRPTPVMPLLFAIQAAILSSSEVCIRRKASAAKKKKARSPKRHVV